MKAETGDRAAEIDYDPDPIEQRAGKTWQRLSGLGEYRADDPEHSSKVGFGRRS
jgi:hypothetical protein